MKRRFIFWLAKKLAIDIVDKYEERIIRFIDEKGELVTVRDEFRMSLYDLKRIPNVKDLMMNSINEKLISSMRDKGLIEITRFDDEINREMVVRSKILIVKP